MFFRHATVLIVQMCFLMWQGQEKQLLQFLEVCQGQATSFTTTTELHHLLGCDEALTCEDLVGQEDDGILCIPTFGQYANCSGSENWLVGPSGRAGPASLRS